VSKNVNKIVQEKYNKSSKKTWVHVLKLAQEELVEVENRAKVLRESIETFKRLAGDAAQG